MGHNAFIRLRQRIENLSPILDRRIIELVKCDFNVSDNFTFFFRSCRIRASFPQRFSTFHSLKVIFQFDGDWLPVGDHFWKIIQWKAVESCCFNFLIVIFQLSGGHIFWISIMGVSNIEKATLEWEQKTLRYQLILFSFLLNFYWEHIFHHPLILKKQ